MRAPSAVPPFLGASALALGLVLALAPGALAADVPIDVYLHELGGGTLHLLPPEINAKTGDTLKLTILNQGADPHDLLVCGDAPKPQSTCERVLARTDLIPAEGTATLSVLLEDPGTFEYHSSQFGEKQAGMRGTLRVTGEPLDKDAPFPATAALLAIAALAILLRRRS